MAVIKDTCMDINTYSTSYLHYYTSEIPKLLKEYLDRCTWSSFVELGCGDGALLDALSKRGYFRGKTAFAIDISCERLNFARSIDPSIKCFQDDVCHIKNLSDESADFIVSKQVIEHVQEEESMVSEISRVLRCSGTAYVSTVFKKKFAWYFHRCNGRWVLDPTHIREYTKESGLLELFVKHGLKVLENRKSLFWFPVTDFIFKRMGFGRNIYRFGIMNLLRKIKVPILGYYEWEMVFQK